MTPWRHPFARERTHVVSSPEVTDRDRTLARLRTALDYAVAQGDPDAVAGGEHTVLAAVLAESAEPDVLADGAVRSALGLRHWLRYLALPDSDDDLDRAVELLTPPTDEDRAALTRFREAVTARGDSGFLSDLGTVLRTLSDATGDAALLDEAVEAGRAAVAAIAPDSPARAGVLSNLGLALHTRFETTGATEALREAVDVERAAAAALSPDHPDRAAVLSNLGIGLRGLFQRTGDVDVLEEAVDVGRDAVAAWPPGATDRIMAWSNLAGSLRALADRTGDPEPLRESVGLMRDVLAATPSDHPGRAMYLGNLCVALFTLYARAGDLDELADAVTAGRAAVAAAPDGSPEQARHAANLGGALRALYARTGEVDVLREAVGCGRASVTATPDGDPQLGGRLANLGATLQTLFDRTGDEDALAEAVQRGRAAVAGTPPDHPNLAMYLSNLSGILQTSFQRFGDLGTLREAVEATRRAVAATPSGHPGRGPRLSNFVAVLHTLSTRTGEAGLLTEAVAAARDSVDATPEDHPDRAGRLANLGVALRALAEESDDAAALDEAIGAAREAVAMTPADHPDRAMYWSNLGAALQTLLERTGDVTALKENVEVAREAVAATPADDPDRARYLFNLGVAVKTSFDRGGERRELDEARSCFAEAAGARAAAADLRVAAARYAADGDLEAGDPAHALVMAERVAELVGLVAPRRLRRADRLHRVTGLHGMAATVAAAAVAAGDPGRAVELLEQTRGLLIADTLDTRGDLGELRRRAAELAAAFDALRDAVEASDHSVDATEEDRADLMARWDELLGRIREVPGLAGFLSAPAVEEIRHAAVEGPVVYLVAHREAGHALVLRDSAEEPVRAVPLPAFTEAAVREQVDVLRAASDALDGDDPLAAQRRILGVLAWMWDGFAREVLDALGHPEPPAAGRPWPRVWWCPVGVATFLPLHAAGRHDGGSDAVLDRVISSYTPTARALLHARALRGPDPAPGRTVVVAVPDAPDVAPLPGATEEAASLRRLVPAATVLPSPGGTTTHDGVTAALTTHDVAHFACHGFADLDNPSDSLLILHDHLTHPLTLTTIARLHLADAGLAYLSACSTTDTGPRHADEATHLTAAFHLAGYRSVVGTLWPVTDRTARAVAHRFYDRLTGGGTPPRPARSAEALHDAVRHRRAARPAVPAQWAAYVHTGL